PTGSHPRGQAQVSICGRADGEGDDPAVELVAGEERSRGIAVVLTDSIVARIDMDGHCLAAISGFKERLRSPFVNRAPLLSQPRKLSVFGSRLQGRSSTSMITSNAM